MCDVYYFFWKWYKMLKLFFIVYNVIKGFDMMKMVKVMKDDENEFLVIMILMKKIKKDFDWKRMIFFDRVVGVLKEVNEVLVIVVEFFEEEVFGMVVVRILVCLSMWERMLMKKKINDILFEVEFYGLE